MGFNPIAIPKGIAPLNSTIGIIDKKNNFKYSINSALYLKFYTPVLIHQLFYYIVTYL